MAPASRPLRPHATQRAPSGPKRTRIEVRLPSKPRDYVPGSGPPLQRLSLLPARDSTAYIVERILLPSPGLAADGKPLPRRMTYIIGWSDLPAARLLVPAMEILSYVSPRDLETWEWNMEMEMEQERAKLEEKRRKTADQTAGKKRRGRPPVHSQIEAGVAAEPEVVTSSRSRPKKGVMSLSTPQKARLDGFESLSENDESPSRQLEREFRQGAYGGSDADLMDVDMDEDGLMDYGSELGDFEEELRQEFLLEPHDLQYDLSEPAFQELEKSETPPVQKPTRLKHPSTTASPMGATVLSSSEDILPATPNQIGSDRTSSFKPAAWSSSVFASQNGLPLANDTTTSQSMSTTSDSKPTVKKQKHSAKELPPEKQPPPKKKRTEPKPAPELDSAEPTDWEVKRLEGVETYDVEGRGLVRYFKVRWEGDWPPDQNPSWEPEDNLPATLIRNYFRNGKRYTTAPRGARPPKKPLVSREREQARKYSSVNELFADNDETVEGTGEEQRRPTNGDLEDDHELFVVDEETKPAKASWKGIGVSERSQLGAFQTLR